MKDIYQLKTKNFTWINVTNPGKPQLNTLKKDYKIHDEDVIDVLPPIQRAKLVEREEYLFMILLFPVYNRQTGDIFLEEVDFFINSNYIITVHNNKIPLIKKFFDAYSKESESFPVNAGELLYVLLEGLLKYCFPMLRHINLDIEKIEKQMFKKFEAKETIEEILKVKTNIVDFKRSLQSHEYLMNKLMGISTKFFPNNISKNKFINLVEYAREIMLSLNSYIESINALHETNSTLVDYRVNEIMKILTLFAVIVFPLTLLSSMFGMNTEHTPFIGQMYDFWKITGVMLIGAITMLGFFKWKRWL